MRRLGWFALVLLVIILDQSTKQLALGALQPYQAQPVLPFLNVTLAFNSGAAFSFLNDAGGWQKWFLTVFALLMSGVLSLWLYRVPLSKRATACGVSLILGGALGNLIDRFHHGFVVDFIELYYRQYHWPVFNIADSAICIGAVLLVLVTLREG